MANYVFTKETPPTLEKYGTSYILENSEIEGLEEVYQAEVPLAQALGEPATGFAAIQKIPTTVKTKFLWKRQGDLKTISTKTTYSYTRTFSQTLTESESLRELIGASVEASTGGAFGEVKATLYAEIENTVERQKSMTQETSETVTQELEPGNTYAFWDLYRIITVEYDESYINQQIELANQAIRVTPKPELMRAKIGKLRALRDRVDRVDSFLYDFEDAREDG
ncbi:MAG: hypothetical protein AAFP82_07450 [Bacteroidota bacterium]